VPVRAVIPEPRFFTLREVAAYLNVGESQVYMLVRSTALPAIRVGGRGRWRVDRERLDRYIDDLHADTAASLDRARRTRPHRRLLEDGAAALTTAEAAAAMGFTVQHVHNLVKNGRLRARKAAGKWYVSEDDVRAYRAMRRGRAARTELTR